jgi:putative acetyltransferase
MNRGHRGRSGSRKALPSGSAFSKPDDVFEGALVAVLTGIGQGLVRFGLESLRQEGVALAFTYGDPAFYSKVGFRPVMEDMIRAPLPLTQPEGWLCQSLIGADIPRIPGESSCVKAFDNPAYW